MHKYQQNNIYILKGGNTTSKCGEKKKKISEKMSGKNNISNVLRGKSKTAKGYHIIYAECNKKYLDFVRYK